MHPRNPHQSRYDFSQLITGNPELAKHVFINAYGDESIDFANPLSVKLLNQAILKSFYGIAWWDIPDNYLCPPIPGRADYIHYLADLVGNSPDVLALDIGTGANCVYPLIGQQAYHWKFIGSEIDPGAFSSAQKIIKENHLESVVELRLQSDPKCIFKNLIRPTDRITVTLCNPPFHASAEDAAKGSNRKLKNLGLKKNVLNFGGKSNELWCPGGEVAFVSKMMKESVLYQTQVKWFTSLISKKENLPALKQTLKELNVSNVKVIEMSQGQKISRILAWSFQQ